MLLCVSFSVKSSNNLLVTFKLSVLELSRKRLWSTQAFRYLLSFLLGKEGQNVCNNLYEKMKAPYRVLRICISEDMYTKETSRQEGC